jgi:hypothetical protein
VPSSSLHIRGDLQLPFPNVPLEKLTTLERKATQMKYLVMKENDPLPVLYPNDVPTREAADKEVERLEAIRLKTNEAAKVWTYSGRGSAMMKPQHSDNKYYVKEIP